MHLADVGAPMILIEWPLMLCALIPIIFIEAEVARRRLKLPYGKAFNAAAKANALSTGAGVPLAWAVMLVIELATMYPIAAAADKWHWSFDSPVLYLSFVLAMAWGGATNHIVVADHVGSNAVIDPNIFSLSLA